MKQVFRIDENGMYIEPVMVLEDQELAADLISVDIPEGFYHPKWDGTTWIEGLTTDEIATLRNAPQPKSEIDILKDQNVELNLQIIDLWENLINGGVL